MSPLPWAEIASLLAVVVTSITGAYTVRARRRQTSEAAYLAASRALVDQLLERVRVLEEARDASHERLGLFEEALAAEQRVRRRLVSLCKELLGRIGQLGGDTRPLRNRLRYIERLVATAPVIGGRPHQFAEGDRSDA